MSSVIDLRTYVGASNSRLLVMIDLQQKNYDELAKDRASDLARSLENCMSAIQHARNLGLPIAFTRQGDNPGWIERSAQSAWISGLEPKRSDMVFERPQPSCYTNQLFEDVVSRIGNFAIAGLVAEATCLATAIDAAHRGHHVTFLNDASVSRGRRDADARSVHVVTTKAMELFADVATTRHWQVATSPRSFKGQRHGRV
jgi:nicotinamidase-related amidase